ncbi:MAG: LPP20 family lipoprotein [Sulfurimonas sp.]|nr:LPP20 family lipoprotein [Sulfurimonas sp.]
MFRKIIASVVIASQLTAVTFSGVGYGNTKDELKKNALSDLSQNISTTVHSNFTSISNVLNDKYDEKIVNIVELKSSLPIKSAHFSMDTESLTASITTKNSLAGYLVELERLQKLIDSNTKNLSSIKDDAILYETLTKLLVYIDDFNSHKIVATMLGGVNLPSINLNSLEVEKQLQGLETKVNSLKAAAKILTNKITQENIYIIPIKNNGTSEVTQFAKVFKTKLMQKLDATDTPNEADYVLRGSYEILKDEIFVSLKLLDDSNKIVNSANIMLDKKAYSKYSYKPKSKNLDDVVNSDSVANGDLSVQLSFQGYPRANGIDLNDGDKFLLYGESNKDICYFLQGSTISKNKNYSYLMERKNGRFTSYIKGDKVKQAVPLFEDALQVGEPFGSEKITLFAQTLQDGKCNIKRPACKTDAKTNLCLVVNSKNKKLTTSQGISQTRSLFSQFHKKNTSTRKVQTAEDTISFTTFR